MSPGLLRDVRLLWLADARLQGINDAVDGSIGLLSEDAPQSKVTGIHVRRAGGSDVLQHEHRHLFVQDVLHYFGLVRAWMNIIWLDS